MLLLILLLTVLLSFFLTRSIKYWVELENIVDDPNSDPRRKKQKKPIPLLGNLGFTFAAALVVFLLWLTGAIAYNFGLKAPVEDINNLILNRPTIIDKELLQNFIMRSVDSSLADLYYALQLVYSEGRRLFWIGLSLLILTLGGYVDDKYHTSPKWQVLFITTYILIALFGGDLVLTNFSYPFNQILPETYWARALLSFAWIGFCVAATKFLDGLDGLVTLVGFTGLLIVAAISFTLPIAQPVPAILALVLAASILGFIPFNFPNAKMYLGEGGSEIIGFLLGVFSLWSGAKLATVSMGIGLFILDWFLVMIMRIKDKRNPITSSDRFHWHHRLFDLGLTKLQVLAITSIFLIIFSSLGLNSPTSQKPLIIMFEIGVLIILLFITTTLSRWKKAKALANPKQDNMAVVSNQNIDTEKPIKKPVKKHKKK
ncbi:MAG: hypothetical protein OHK0017_13200 [Patescibacteria group bacterium]